MSKGFDRNNHCPYCGRHSSDFVALTAEHNFEVLICPCRSERSALCQGCGHAYEYHREVPDRGDARCRLTTPNCPCPEFLNPDEAEVRKLVDMMIAAGDNLECAECGQSLAEHHLNGKCRGAGVRPYLTWACTLCGLRNPIHRTAYVCYGCGNDRRPDLRDTPRRTGTTLWGHPIYNGPSHDRGYPSNNGGYPQGAGGTNTPHPIDDDGAGTGEAADRWLREQRRR